MSSEIQGGGGGAVPVEQQQQAKEAAQAVEAEAKRVTQLPVSGDTQVTAGAVEAGAVAPPSSIPALSVPKEAVAGMLLKLNERLNETMKSLATSVEEMLKFLREDLRQRELEKAANPQQTDQFNVTGAQVLVRLVGEDAPVASQVGSQSTDPAINPELVKSAKEAVLYTRGYIDGAEQTTHETTTANPV